MWVIHKSVLKGKTSLTMQPSAVLRCRFSLPFSLQTYTLEQQVVHLIYLTLAWYPHNILLNWNWDNHWTGLGTGLFLQSIRHEKETNVYVYISTNNPQLEPKLNFALWIPMICSFQRPKNKQTNWVLAKLFTNIKFQQYQQTNKHNHKLFLFPYPVSS